LHPAGAAGMTAPAADFNDFYLTPEEPLDLSEIKQPGSFQSYPTGVNAFISLSFAFRQMKLQCFVPVKHSQPSLIFESKFGAYLSVAPF
jgi:hypothetical protein